MHILPFSAKEVEKKLETIPGHWGEIVEYIVDTEFKPESINAQSGTAVEEAIESVITRVAPDTTLEIAGQAADAKVVGDKLEELAARNPIQIITWEADD